ncbi:MAG: hypothetical protein KDA75_14065, partial [Planctomycetaceae bacterium]|nr:hypothetical protein [Planctomycetaceae bacterium]
MLRQFRFLLAGLLIVTSSRLSADDLFDGLSPGLLGRYTSESQTRARVDRDITFDWGPAAPFPEFSRGESTAVWTGTLLVKSDTTYQFSAFAKGKVKIEIDGHIVLDAGSEDRGWLTGPETPLEFGFLPITVSFTGSDAGAACKVYWSSKLFPREPLPHHLLFHEQDDTNAQLVERGRVLFDTHRCNRCHVRRDSLISAEAPPFIAIAADINPDWIVAKLRHHNVEAADAKMPSFGYNEEEAFAIGAWLWAINQPPRIAPLRAAEPDKKKDSPDGLTLVRSLGCLACHKVGDLGESGPYGGGDLSHIGAKRTGDWIYTWLFQPDRIN